MALFRPLPLVALLGLAPGGPVLAQAAAELRQLDLATADFGAARLAGREFGLRLRSPGFAFAGGRFAFGADYTYTHYDYTGLPTRNRDLHRLAVPLARTWNGERVDVRAELAPTVATSSNVFQDLFERGGSDDFNLYGRVTLEHTPAHGWGWRAGAAYDDAFGERRAYPLLAALYRSPRVELELGWPQAQLHWQARERLALGLRVAPAGGRWHVVSDERGGAEFFYTTEAWRGAAVAEWTFAPRWHLGAALGVEFDRHHDFEDDTGARVDADADSTGLFWLNVRYGD